MVRIDLGRYRVVRVGLDEAFRFLRSLGELRGYTTDLREGIRYIENFDAFYQASRKRFRDYLVPLKDTRDMILGKVTIDKVKLIQSEHGKEVEIVLDRRVPIDTIINALRNAGYDEVKVEEES